MNQLVQGIITPILTPMYEDESINFDELRNQVNRLIAAGVSGLFCFGTNGESYIISEEEKYASAIKVSDLASELLDSEKAAGTIEVGMNYSTIKQELYNSFYSMFGGILFLGIFLGLLFLMGAAMIIYYKQVSEGYEDKERFEIMQKVGMTHKEVKSSIHRQILMVFFLPLGMAALHIAMAFPMVKRLLALFSMTNSGLFARCTVVTLLVFALVYGVIYGLTAKVYYKIVERQ